MKPDESTLDAIIREWEQSHRPRKKWSRLNEFDGLIRQKIDEGYTQQAVVELLEKLGCYTSHQNLSRYLKRHHASGKKVLPQQGVDRQPKSAFGELKQKMQES